MKIGFIFLGLQVYIVAIYIYIFVHFNRPEFMRSDLFQTLVFSIPVFYFFLELIVSSIINEDDT